ncbi:outer membrane beta-barrel protein [Colwellia sp. MB3u-55]|uniref:outer membrane beta-barrel protein n=1 Tax=Colwellia sp. MB3u-55 TaxID=2759810 RepID=UPI0015F4723A|nr:outer membrane beta-barrel protein [Colwellia sp. MB3u-55]MBA6251144.1 outer membrane beta-barrel protein [Colwellia sp. MB3u-55]
MVIFRLFVILLIAFAMTLLTSFALKAETDFALESGDQFTATLLSEYGQISNFLNQGSDEKSTSYIKIEPSVFIQTQLSRHLIQLATKVSHYQFNNFSEDDHNNLLFKPSYFFKLDHNKTLFADIKLQESYEYRGTGLSLGNAESITSGDDKKSLAANIGYLYGQIDSVAKLKLSIGQEDFRYKTRRAENKALDRVDQSVAASFDYLLSEKTYFATDLAYTQSNFQNNSPLNKDIYALLVGMKWQSTAITQLQALIGYQRLTFEETLFASDTRFKWRVDINWQPTNFMQMNINTQRNYETTNRIVDSYRVVDSTNLQLTHQLTDYFQTSAVVGYKQEKVVYLEQTINEDYLYSEVRLNYQRNDWLTVFAGFTFKELTASDDRLNNQGNSLSLGFNVNI